jgi:hypothetical protein
MAVGICHADHVAPCQQKLALTSPTSDGRSVGIVRSRTQATELVIISMCFILTHFFGAFHHHQYYFHILPGVCVPQVGNHWSRTWRSLSCTPQKLPSVLYIHVLCEIRTQLQVFLIWGYIRKFSDCCNCLGEERLKGRPRSHFCKPIASYVTWQCAVYMHCFCTSAFSTSCFILHAMDGKIEGLREARYITTKTLEILRDAFGEYSLSWTVVFECNSCFTACWVSVDDDKHSRQPSTSRMTENVKVREFTHKDCRQTIHQLTDTTGFSYGVCKMILIET